MTKKYGFLHVLFQLRKIYFAPVLKIDFFNPKVERKNKNDLDEGVRKCEHWSHIDLIKTYEQR